MKKLMIAAAIVCAAAFAQAATVDWSFEGSAFDWGAFAPAEGTMAVYLASDMNTPLANSPFTLDEGGMYSGTVTGTDQAGWVARLTVNNFAEGGSWYKDYAFTMDSVTHAGSPDAATYLADLALTVAGAFDGIDLNASAASQGYTSVPEPTSGLLLLLGVAGLALKRKRA